jgi:hypothetical protein
LRRTHDDRRTAHRYPGPTTGSAGSRPKHLMTPRSISRTTGVLRHNQESCACLPSEYADHPLQSMPLRTDSLPKPSLRSHARYFRAPAAALTTHPQPPNPIQIP